ncbi:aquaporin-like protein [Tricladium varicosporioides]|nr:aquaporin-like protein [Hymenoscyphus varicosporioides]
MVVEDSVRDLLVSTIGEFVGTFMFLFIAFISAATVNQPNTNGEVPSSPDPARVLFIALGFGFGLAVNAWVFFRVSGSAFNPAVTFALCVLGAVPFVTSICVVAAQILGGMAAAIVVKLIVPGNAVHFAVSLAPGVTDIQGFFIEMFLTFELVITILMLAGEKTKVTFIAPVGIGLSLFIDHLAGAFWTGAGLNPARSFGAAVAAMKFPGYHWIYWFGPLAGAFLAAGLYKLLKILHYENVNGHQDKSADEEAFKPLLADQTSKIERFFQRTQQVSTILLIKDMISGPKASISR